MMRRFLLPLAVLAAACAQPDRADRADRTEPGGRVDAEPNDLAREQHCEVPAPPEDLETVQVVFSCGELAVDSWRVFHDEGPDSLTFALQSLLEGPNSAERSVGLSSFFSAETAGMLNRAEVRDGVAFIDFADFSRIIPNASTSAGSAQLLDQLAGTIFQFDGIREAEISFDGSCDAFWNWLQRGCERLPRGGP